MSPGTTLVLNFLDDKGYLCQEKPLDLLACSVPNSYTKFVNPASWLLKVLAWIPQEKRLFAEIIDYRPSHTPISKEQLDLTELLLQIDKITFNRIQTAGLMNTAKGGAQGKVSKEINSVSITLPNTYNNTHAELAPSTKALKLSFKHPIKDLLFRLGSVSFTKFIKEANKTLEFTIINHDLRAEFDAVKNYFSNKLGTKKITVNTEIKIQGDEILDVTSTSPEISSINQQFIESVKFEFVGKLVKPKNWQVYKSVFTSDEYFDLLTEQKVNANPFGDSDQALMDGILNIHQTKHYKNLRFLASNHLYKVLKLRFVLKPFSFIFLLEGKNKYHIAWETLDTEEATYVWESDKNREQLQQRLVEIENIISIVKVQGKTAYLHSDLLKCRRIYHDYSDLIEGFVKWKGEFESILY